MKKIVLSLTGVLAATAFAPEASAIPAFARQTGMACNACHAQHFPVLNGFGRAFKAAGFTLMGAQGRVEGEHLSIPDTLNGAILMKIRYQKTNGKDAAGAVSGSSTNSGQWQFPDEFSLFLGGRVAESESIKVGMMLENSLVGNAVGTAGIASGVRVPVVYETEAVKLSVVPYTTDSLGAFYGYTESSNGLNRAIRWAENRTQVFAHQFTGIGNGANTGLAFVAHTDIAYVNVSRFAPTWASAIQMSSTLVHAAFTPTIADFATIFSVEYLTGESYTAASAGSATAAATSTKVATKGMGLSAQAHGELAGMEAGLYAAYSVAKKSDVGAVANLYNSDTVNDKKAAQVGAEVTVVPHTLHVGLNYLAGKVQGQSQNYVTVTGAYDVAQNVALVANYSLGSGNSFNAGGVNDAVTAAPNGFIKNSKNLLTLMLEGAW